MPPSELRPLLASWLGVALVVLLGGCPGVSSVPDTSVWVNTTGTDDGAAADDTTTGTVDDGGVDETGAAEGGGGGPPLACSMPSMFGDYEFDVATTERYPTNGVLEAVDICNLPELVGDPADESPILSNDPDTSTSGFAVYVYHPVDELGEWPEAPPMPGMFLMPGAGLRVFTSTPPATHHYAQLIERAVAAGVIVFAIEAEDVGQGTGSNWNSGVRRAALACAMMWAKDTSGWNQGDNAGRLSDNIVIAGQSRGGAAAYLLTEDLMSGDDLPTGTALDDYEQCGTVSIAQRFAPGDAADPVASNVPILQAHAPPLLALLGAVDNDTRGEGIAAFDQRVPEDAILHSKDDQHMPLGDAVLVDVYGATHKAFGGASGGLNPGALAGLDQARTAGAFYLEQWIRWHVFDDMTARDWILRPTRPDVSDADFPDADPDLTDPALWSETELAAYYGAAQRPLIHVDYTPGIDPDGNEGAARFVIDTMTRAQLECDAQISDSTYGSAVTASTEASTEVCVGAASALLTGISASSFDAHDTDAMRVSWGQGAAGVAEVEWSLTKGGNPLDDVTDYTHLSFRIANLVEDDDAGCDDTFDSFDVTVELESQSPSGTVVRSISVPTVIDREQRVISPDGAANCGLGDCCGHQAMHTVRIPLADALCSIDPVDPQDPIAIDYLTAIRLSFPLASDQHALIDSLEFTKDPTAAGTATCPAFTAGWNCPASIALVAVETSCKTEPGPSGCAPGDVDQNQVALPVVDDGLPGEYSGWVVHTPAGWTHPSSPTSDEIDLVLAQCVQACELEWSDDPNVAATCSASAFLTPTLRQSPDVGPEHRIHPDFLHGEGLFGAQVLAYDLQDDACEAFDESLCAASPTRTTSALMPLRRAEELRVGLSTLNSKATFITPGGSFSVPLSGEVGYSNCPAGASGTTCPFYLGSLDASATTSLTVADTCPDSSSFTAVVSDFHIELLQPAFGIADAGSVSKAFPPGALYIEGFITVDGNSYLLRTVNTDPVYASASATAVFAADLPVDLQAVGLEVPCGSGTIPVSLEIDLRSSSVLESPPTISITTGSLVSCAGRKIALTHTASDPDSDLARVRWYVDDVLIAPGVSSIPFHGPHQLRAVAYDARGAATTAVKSIGCR